MLHILQWNDLCTIFQEEFIDLEMVSNYLKNKRRDDETEVNFSLYHIYGSNSLDVFKQISWLQTVIDKLYKINLEFTGPSHILTKYHMPVYSNIEIAQLEPMGYWPGGQVITLIMDFVWP